MRQSSKLELFVLFCFIVITWGISWPINKLGLDYLSPVWYTAVRLIIGTVSMFIIVIASKNFLLPTARDIPLIIVIGLLQIAIFLLFVNIGLSYLPAGRSSLLAYTTPLWVMPIAILFFGEKGGLLRWTGFYLGMLGLFLLLNPGEMNWHDNHVIFGSVMLLLASFVWAISIICTRNLRWTKSPLQLIAWQLLLATVPILIYAVIAEPSVKVIWHHNLYLSLFYTGVIVTGLSYWSGVVVTKNLSSTVVSLGLLAVPVVSLVTSAIFMHEPITLTTGVAMLSIILGLVCVVI